MKLLPSLQEQGCTRCKKLVEARTHIVPSYLPEGASLLFVAEAPGESEDAEGREPLVGRAGQRFDYCLRKVGLVRKECGIANVIRCRPATGNPAKPNRPPRPTEIQSCAPYLDAEIAALQPKLIVALGATAFTRLTGLGGIEKLRGKVFHTQMYGPVIGTFHPARILRVPQEEPLFLQDLTTAKNFIADTAHAIPQDVSHRVVRTMSQAAWLFEELRKAEMFSFDIETSATDYLNSKILSVSFSWKERTAVTLPFYKQGLVPMWGEADYATVFNGLKAALENPQSKKIAQNGKFDIQHLFSAGISVRNFYADTLLMHYLIDENLPHDLKTLAMMYTDAGGYEDDLLDLRKSIAKSKGIPYTELSFAELPEEELWKYANMDADVTLRLFHVFWPEIQRQKLEGVLFELLMPMSKELGRIEYDGISVDVG